MSQTLRGSLLALGALAAVGSQVAASDVVENYPLATGQALRYALAGLVLLAIARWRLPRLAWHEALRLVLLAGCGLVLFNVFLIGGVREGDPATVGVIVGCVPVVLAVAGPLLERRPVRPRVVAAALLVAAGAAAVQWAGGEVTPAGLAFSLGALACEAAFSLLAIPLLARLGPLAVSTYACLLAVPMLTLWSVVADGPVLPAPSLEEAAALAYIAVLVTVFGFVAWYSALSLLGVERAGLFSGAIPVSALLCSALVGAAELTPARLAAGAVVALGVTLGVRAGAPASPAAGAVPPLELARPAPGTAAG